MADNLAALFASDDVGRSQQLFMVGTITAFPGPNGQNTVNCNGTIYTNLQILYEGGGYAVGNTVLLARTATKPIILGTLVTPT